MLLICFQPAQELGSKIPGSVPKTRPGGLFGFKTNAPFFPGIYIYSAFPPSPEAWRGKEEPRAAVGPTVGVQAARAGPPGGGCPAAAEAGFDSTLNTSLGLWFPAAGARLDRGGGSLSRARRRAGGTGMSAEEGKPPREAPCLCK